MRLARWIGCATGFVFAVAMWNGTAAWAAGVSRVMASLAMIRCPRVPHAPAGAASTASVRAANARTSQPRLRRFPAVEPRERAIMARPFLWVGRGRASPSSIDAGPCALLT